MIIHHKRYKKQWPIITIKTSTPRRKFIQTGALISAGILTNKTYPFHKLDKKRLPLDDGAKIISTWSHGIPAGKRSIDVLNNGGSLLDAVQYGINLVEDDPENHSVGIGGYPDAQHLRDRFRDAKAGRYALLGENGQGLIHPGLRMRHEHHEEHQLRQNIRNDGHKDD